MSGEYKFLILEDVESDAELVIDQIISSGLPCSFRCTDNEADFKRQISEFKPDLILSDYTLPTYNGMAALKYVLANYPDIPVILVTGSINEETAVNCMKAGAVDYILKDKMSRLGLAVQNELKNKKIKLERSKALEELKESEKYYRNVMSHLHEDLIIIDENFIITDINNSFLSTTGKKRKDTVGKHCFEISHTYNSPCNENGEICHLKDVFLTKKHSNYIHEHIKTDGSKTWVDIVLSPLFDENGNVTKVIQACRNIDDIMHAQDEIKKLSTVVDQSPLGISLLDLDGKIQYTNSAFTILTGYKPEEVLGRRLDILDSESLSFKEHKSDLFDALNGQVSNKTYNNTRKNGEKYSSSSFTSPYRDSSGKVTGLIVIQEDITQRLLDKNQIESDLKEKELLLQEIYHRVNNNMQIMISLLNMQVDRTDSEGEKSVLMMAQSRLGAMSAIYNDIYQEKSFIAIKFGNVTQHIFNFLCDSLMVISGNIELKVDAEIPDFGLDLAQPCALIVNELMSNSMRHAYPGGKGKIYVSLTIDKFGELILVVRDEGIGLPESIDPENSDTTGFNLVYMLATGQLDGSVNINRDHGTRITVKFKRIFDKKRF